MLDHNQINELSFNLLSNIKNQTINITHIPDLREVIRFHEHRYYILNNPILGDSEYDLLFNTLKKLELAHPETITPDSPTQRVGADLYKSFNNVDHLVPMLSLENSFEAADLLDWDRKNKETLKSNHVQYCVEPKFDGASISLIYENDLLVRGATRGNGVMGDDITNNIKQIKSIPLSAKFSEHNIQQIEIRGEILLNKKNFYDYNKQLEAQNLPPLANPRNAAAGSLRLKDPKEVSKRNLEAFLYHVSYYTTIQEDGKDPLPTHSGSLDLLWDLGFKSPKLEMKICNSIEEVIAYCAEYEQKRDDLPYEIDGMVIKVNAIADQEALGMTTHHPRWAMAFKFKARQATSILRNVEFQVGRTGSITPVAKIEPVGIGGVTVSSISLFNEEVIREKDLKIGDTVLVERAGDVIPYIVRSLPELRNESCQDIVFPTHCPVCSSTLVKPVDEAVWRCINDQCGAQIVEKMIHFTSKDAMDIRGLGDSIIRKFNDLKFLNNITDIYALPYEKISVLEGFGVKSIQNLQSAIEASKKQPLHRLIFALGIRYVGETTAKTLANAITSIYDLKDWSVEKLQSLEDIGPKVANSVYEFFRNPKNLELIQQLEQLGVEVNHKEVIHINGNLSGSTFLFTGTLSKLKRSEAEALVEQNGGKILTGVSSKLNYLVAGEAAGSKLEKAKKLSGVKIITEDEFLTMINR